jgi:hypothetical protein
VKEKRFLISELKQNQHEDLIKQTRNQNQNAVSWGGGWGRTGIKGPRRWAGRGIGRWGEVAGRWTGMARWEGEADRLSSSTILVRSSPIAEVLGIN